MNPIRVITTRMEIVNYLLILVIGECYEIAIGLSMMIFYAALDVYDQYDMCSPEMPIIIVCMPILYFVLFFSDCIYELLVDRIRK